MSVDAAEYPTQPATFTDAEGREIALRAFEGDPEERAALEEMYCDFDPADRAQGIPPVGEEAVERWLVDLLGDGSLNVVAWDGDRAVGHATLVADRHEGYELAIFVAEAHQGAGIGTRLIRHLLGHGAANGVEDVWLTVERWNRPAVALYERVGFEVVEGESFELEMALSLD
jgi:ribosomal protein S18 acetylase RimI-like enzyme